VNLVRFVHPELRYVMLCYVVILRYVMLCYVFDDKPDSVVSAIPIVVGGLTPAHPVYNDDDDYGIIVMMMMMMMMMVLVLLL